MTFGITLTLWANPSQGALSAFFHFQGENSGSLADGEFTYSANPYQPCTYRIAVAPSSIKPMPVPIRSQENVYTKD